MMLEDEELRDTFKMASEEHLQNLDDGLLHLEKHPDDQAQLEELLREAHSLKGDAGMLGIKDVSTLAHQLEHILGSLKRGEAVFSNEISDRLFRGLDAIRKLVCEAVTGEAASVNTFHILAYMMGATDTATARTPALLNQNGASEAESKPIVEPVGVRAIITPQPTILEVEVTDRELPQLIAPQPHLVPAPSFPLPEMSAQQSSPATPVSEPVATSTYHIETIRVETRNLDTLMTQAGELTVTKTKIARRLAEVEEIVTLWEEWSRDAFTHRVFNKQAPLYATYRHDDGAVKQAQDFHQRAEARLERLGILVNQLRNAVYEDTARLDVVADKLESGIAKVRLLPLSTIFQLVPRVVRDLAKQQGKEVHLVIEGGETAADKRILEEMKDPLMHLIRNAIDHGIETPEERDRIGKQSPATIRLRGYQNATTIVIEVADDGQGLDIEKIKQTALKRGICREEELAIITPTQIQSLIFAPGFSTRTFVTQVSGRGVGLDVVRTNVERLKGTIEVESAAELGCTFRVQLGTTLATAPVLVVAVNGTSYALPVEFVQTMRWVSESEIFTMKGQETIVLNNQPVSITRLGDLLELPLSSVPTSQKAHSDVRSLPCIILKVGDELLGLKVDDLLDRQDVVLKPQSKLLKRVRNVSGATILGTGEVCIVLNPQDLIKSVRQHSIALTPEKHVQNVKQQVILLVEDSIATRIQEKRILESAGYEVVIAVDGLDGFNKLRTRSFDAVVSDVQMPNLDGLALTAKIRQYREYNELPIILVTSLATDEDKRKGVEAGANAYIPKGNFNQEVLLETLRRLV